MNRLERDVVILALLEELKSRGSRSGETHLQEAIYFLQEPFRVPLGCGVPIFYKHGPYSFDLADEFTALRADYLVEVKSTPAYGPSLLPAPGSRDLIVRFHRTFRTYEEPIRFVVTWFAGKNVAELQKIGTALYVTISGPGNSVESRAERIQELRLNVRLEEVREALQMVDQMSTAARELQVRLHVRSLGTAFGHDVTGMG